MSLRVVQQIKQLTERLIYMIMENTYFQKLELNQTIFIILTNQHVLISLTTLKTLFFY